MTADRMAGTMKSIAATYGKSSLRLPNKVERITTGSTMLDVRLGGGLPVGWVTEFWGDKSSGKSTTAIRTAGINQKLCRRCYRPAKDLKMVQPDDPDDRWLLEGFCDCVASGVVPIAEVLPPRLVHANGKEESAKAWKERKEAVAQELQENSYEEFIVAYCDPENAFDIEWAVTVGAMPQAFVFLRPETAEEAVDQLGAICHSTFADLLIVDSLAHFTPSKEIEESAFDWQRGLAARLVNKGIRKWVSGAVKTSRSHGSRHGLTQIWINQMRMKIGVTKGDPSVKPAGMGQDFAARYEVRFGKSYIDSSKDMVEVKYGSEKDKFDIPVREAINFRIIKGPMMKKSTGSYIHALRDGDEEKGEWWKTGDVIEHDELFKTMNYWGMIEKVEKGKMSERGYHFAGNIFQTQSELKKAIVTDPDLHKAVREIIFDKVVRGRG